MHCTFPPPFSHHHPCFLLSFQGIDKPIGLPCLTFFGSTSFVSTNIVPLFPLEILSGFVVIDRRCLERWDKNVMSSHPLALSPRSRKGTG